MRNYLEIDGLKFKPCDPCVSNKIIEGEPLKLVIRVNDVKKFMNTPRQFPIDCDIIQVYDFDQFLSDSTKPSYHHF